MTKNIHAGIKRSHNYKDFVIASHNINFKKLNT
jgi:hypothetical protein